MSSLKKAVKAAIGLLLRLFGRGNVIVFESVPDFADNTYAVYCRMLELGLNRKYTFVWSCFKDVTMKDAPADVRYVYPMRKSLKEKLKNAYYMANAKCLICCNRFLIPLRQSQPSFFLTHGTSIKYVRNYYNLPEEIQYCLAAAPDVAEMTAYQLRTENEKMFSLGFPRNDILTQPQTPAKELMNTDCEKVIVWYPTYRQSAAKAANTGSTHALPVIHDENAAAELNQWAKEHKVLLVLKPHFAQDLSKIKDMKLSNIQFIDDSFFQIHNTSSYAFVAGCDAMITDYSSIFYDYLLCDKPVALVWEDVEEYRKDPGFCIDLDVIAKGGVTVYNMEDFKRFIREVATEEDSCREERRKLRDMTNYAADGKNTQRVTDFIIEKANL